VAIDQRISSTRGMGDAAPDSDFAVELFNALQRANAIQGDQRPRREAVVELST
jgi:hypothetical protein